MVWAENLGEEIEAMFAALIIPAPPDSELEDSWFIHPSRWKGYHVDRDNNLSLVKKTRRSVLSEAARKEKRQTLELNRREYKTLKQREYDRKKKKQ